MPENSEIVGTVLEAKPKRIFNVDDVDLAIGTIGLLGAIAIGVIAYKLTGSAAGTAVAGIFGTAATGIGSLARGRKRLRPDENGPVPWPPPMPGPTPGPEPEPTPGPFGPIEEPVTTTGGSP